MPAGAPVNEIGYAQAPNYNWWLYDEETTPELIWPQSVAVYEAMRTQDAQVASVLRAVTLPVRRTPWRIDPAGARPEVAQFVADDLGLPIVGRNPSPPPRTRDRFSWPEHLRQALLMLPFGHMYFEIVFRVTGDGARAHLRKLAPRMPKTIERIEVAEDGGLISIKQWWTRTDAQPRPIPVDRLVAYVHDREGGNWLGRSLLRPAYKHWLIKDRLLRVQAQTIERNGMGVPLYKGQEDASAEDLAAGKAMATAWRAGEAAGSAVPHGADLILRGVEGDLPDADPAIRYHDEQIARAVLAHFLNLGTQTGSWALGTTFADFFTLSLQTLAQQIADTATQHIVEDIVDANFGEQEPAPRLVFDEIGSRQAATAQALKALVDAGVIHPDQVLEEASRQQYGLPPQDPARTTTPPDSAAGGDGDPKVVAAGAAVAELDDLDWDDALEALLVALAELSGQVTAAWDPAKHPRNPPGSPGAGRFRSLVDRLKDAVQDHLGGGGTGDPFDGFDREQLRRAARSRGITLRRGEDRDSIAQKLLDELRDGKDSSVKTPTKSPKPRTRAPRKPKPLTPDQEMVRWRAEAAKPGRVDSGRTRRDAYVASWEENIARAKKDLARAEAVGDTGAAESARKDLAYYTRSRDAILSKVDPDLDRPEGAGGTLAQSVDPDRPLAVYGDMLHLDAADDRWTHLNLTEIERIPAELHGLVAERMAAAPLGGFWVGEGGVSGLDHASDLHGVNPRGWNVGDTFDDVNGVYRPGYRQIIVGRTANSQVRGGKTASHEFGHALDHALGDLSSTPDWQALHTRVVAGAPYLSPYYKQTGRAGPQEFWAEAFSAWVSARRERPGYETRATYIVRLNISAKLADEIHDYFTRVAAAKGVR